MKITIILFIIFIFILSSILIFLLNRIKKLLNIKKQLEKEKLEEYSKLNQARLEQEVVKNNISDLSGDLQKLQTNVINAMEHDKRISQEAFSHYFEVLEQNYNEKEKEWDNYTNTLTESYANLQQKLIDETEEYRKELDKLKETRAAAIEALVREKEIEEKLSFYCLQISEKDLADVKILEEVKIKLNNERILCMLIWQTFFQKSMNTLCANVLGAGTKCGIYKITNILTKECYIGQAVNIADRWKQHAKCGLGIDTPAGNKLYKAIKEYGIWNFSWELLEECPPAQLNEKEKFYISLYDSYNFGYNSNRGNS